MMKRNTCHGCCWFTGEDADGWGVCSHVPCGYCDDWRLCSDPACGYYLGRKEARHHLAVLTQANRYRRDSHVPAIYRMPEPRELGMAIDFSIGTMKRIFGYGREQSRKD